MSTPTKPVPIALPTKLLEDIDNAASKTSLSKAEVMRQAMKLGLTAWAEVGFDLESTVVHGLLTRHSAPTSNNVSFPVLGEIAAGLPTDGAQRDGEFMMVPLSTAQHLRPGEQGFILRVRGDSMINAGIHDGDSVLCAVRPPRANDIVVALVDGENTLKRYSFDGGKITLKAENPRFKPIVPRNDLQVQGVMVAVVPTSTKTAA